MFSSDGERMVGAYQFREVGEEVRSRKNEGDTGLKACHPPALPVPSCRATRRKSLTEIPGLTVKLKKSKRIVKRLLDDFDAAITVFLDKAESIQLRFSR